MRKVIFCGACGLYFALLQFSYFFLLEAFLSSQYLAYFIVLLFWLGGFLVGLQLKNGKWFGGLLILSLAAYYGAWTVTHFFPFHALLYPLAAACAVISGLLPGFFFPFMTERFPSVKMLLFHENNGFVLGILISLKAAIHMGSWFLAYGAALGAVFVAGLYWMDRNKNDSTQALHPGEAPAGS